MKFFNTIFIIVSLFIFSMCVSNLFAQDGYVNSFDGSDVPLVEEPTNFVPGDNVTNINRDPRVNTDEYGSQSVNRAVYFGSGSITRRVRIPSDYDFDVDYSGSIEMWVYPTDLSNDVIFFSKGNTQSTMNYFVSHNPISSKGLVFGLGGVPGYFFSGVLLSENSWTHIAVTWGMDAGANIICRFYRNGDLVATKTEPYSSYHFFNNDPIIIGGSNAWNTCYMKGYIDEVRIWDVKRTTAQIRDNRFVGLGDFANANTDNALTSSSHYDELVSSWTFNFNSSIAYDDIGQHHGTYMGGCGVSTRLAGHPIPYNLALKCDGFGTNSYVKIPDNSIFDQTSSGSFEAWIYLNATGFQPIFQKGSTFFNTTFAVGISSYQKLFLNIGGHSFIGSTTFAIDKWCHIAATWSGGPYFTVKLYVNGVLDTTHTHYVTMPTNSDDAWIGRDYGNHRFNGYIDEVRIWNPALTQEQIKNNLIISGRALLQDSQLEGFWNFDGHLGNFSSTSGIDGSFNTGTGNDCRLSGYINENISGAYNLVCDAHTTVLNGTYVNQAYFRGKSGLPISDQGYVQDTIKVTKWPSSVSTVHALISIQHQFCEDIDIRITAPNGQTRDISTDNGGISNNGYLTIFYDGHTQPVTSSSFLSPWSNYVKPEVVMGNFGGSSINGNWILRVTDDTPGDSGTLMGWGLRFNNSVINVSPISTNVPGEYKLHQNYPNPFNPVTNINFDIPNAGIVSIKVYDITGREISTLVNQSLKAGSYNVEFDASNYASGTYFYKIQAGDFIDVKKMMLVK